MGLIEIRNLFVLRQDNPVLKDITLTFPEGKISTIIGSTGSGKSTLLKTAAGLVTYEGGQVFFNGKDMALMSEGETERMQSRTGFMFQDAALWSNRNLYENLSFPILAADRFISKKDLNDRIIAAFKSMDYKDDPQLRPAAISAGERKIISFLRAVINNPDVLFLDDPTTSIDRRSFNLLVKHIRDYREKGCTIIVVTENPLFIKQLSDYLFFLADGKLAAQGTFQELSTSEDPVLATFFNDL